MKLELCIATLGDAGICRVAELILPPAEGVGYVVSWQTDNPFAELPEALCRPDIRVVSLSGRGLSRNRNNALDHSIAELVMIVDDDCRYTPESLRDVITVFEAHPEIDFALFPFAGNNHKVYPSEPTDAGAMPRGYHASSIELVVRRRVVEAGVRYPEMFGLGAELPAGEDELFLLTLRRLGYKGMFFPEPVACHNGPSTGYRKIENPKVAEAMGAVIGIAYPATAPLRLPLKAWRMSRAGQMPLFRALKALCRGYFRQFSVKRPWKK